MLIKNFMTQNPVILSPEEDIKVAFNLLSDKHVRSDGDVRIAMATSIGSADIRPVTQEEVMQACGS